MTTETTAAGNRRLLGKIAFGTSGSRFVYDGIDFNTHENERGIRVLTAPEF